jgi:hypothetical protein
LEVVVSAMRRSGIDPDRAARIPAVVDLVARWIGGEIYEKEFLERCAIEAAIHPEILLSA